MQDIVIYGAGGLAREIEFIINRINEEDKQWNFCGFVVSNTNREFSSNESVDRIVGDDDWLFKREKMNVALGIGLPQYRVSIGKKISRYFSDNKLPILIDPSVIYDHRTCYFCPGSIIAAGAVLTVNIFLGDFGFINLNCTVGHEASIGAGCVLNPSVNISGGVDIGYGCLVGTGAQVLQNLSIGTNSVIGAGAVVTKNIPNNVVAVGVPARLL